VKVILYRYLTNAQLLFFDSGVPLLAFSQVGRLKLSFIFFYNHFEFALAVVGFFV